MTETSYDCIDAAGSPTNEALGQGVRQCAAALPVGAEVDADQIFDGLARRHLRPRQDQKVADWVRRPRSFQEPART